MPFAPLPYPPSSDDALKAAARTALEQENAMLKAWGDDMEAQRDAWAKENEKLREALKKIVTADIARAALAEPDQEEATCPHECCMPPHKVPEPKDMQEALGNVPQDDGTIVRRVI